jgi:hypothetical protein
VYDTQDIEEAMMMYRFGYDVPLAETVRRKQGFKAFLPFALHIP